MILDSSRVETIDRLLSANIIYKVPRYQRCFSWEKEHIETFWEDLLDTKKDSAREDYFLGSMIFRKINEGEMEIIDGQQRLVVITIFFSCIRDYYLNEGNMQGVAEINPIYIGRRREGSMQFKLKLNEQDNIFFQSYIQEDGSRNFGSTRGLPESHKLILNARNIIYEKICEELQKCNNEEDKKIFLEDLKDTVTNKFKVLSTYVDSIDEAYVVFETLNDRGLDLSIADLLKNYLYSKAGERLENIRTMWEEIMDMLNGKEISKFLRCYWNSSKKLIREKYLYKALKNHIRNNREVLSFVKELRDEAEVYNNLINPNNDNWHDKKLVKLLEDLKSLGARQIYPLLLSAYKKFGASKQFKITVELSTVLTFRYSIICGLNPNKLEDEYSDIAVKLRQGKDLTYVKQKFLQLNPNNETFLQEFNKKEITNQKIARYLLIKITERLLRGTDVGTDEDISLEHIMPQKPSLEWKKYIIKQNINHEDFIDRIGNLTLLTGPRNRGASNKLFQIKCKEIYRKSFLPITKDICRYKQWNEEIIIERQKKLAEIAKNIWKL